MLLVLIGDWCAVRSLAGIHKPAAVVRYQNRKFPHFCPQPHIQQNVYIPIIANITKVRACAVCDQQLVGPIVSVCVRASSWECGAANNNSNFDCRKEWRATISSPPWRH
jgi:hypothetical protein